MQTNMHECSGQYELTPDNDSVVIKGVRFYYRARTRTAPPCPCLMWLSDGSIIASRIVYKADYYALAFMAEFD